MLELGNIFIFGWIGGIQWQFCSRNLVLRLFMMLIVLWKPSSLLLFRMVIGFGGLLDQRLWWRFKPEYMKLVLVLVISLFEVLQGKKFMFVLKLGRLLG
jgi:hypothetical protein